jgi:hypothetical protein
MWALGSFLRERLLKAGKIGARGHEQAVDVE